MIIPEDLKARTEAAILRITTGQAPMRVPVDPSDPDVVLAEWLRVATPMPTADADPEVLATVTLGGYFSSEELGDIDIEPVMSALEQIQQDVVRSDDDAHLELVDRAHVTRLQAEVSALQQRLTIADQRVDDLEGTLRIVAVAGSGSTLAGLKMLAKQGLNRAATAANGLRETVDHDLKEPSFYQNRDND